MIYTGTIYVIQARTTIMGPNDAYCIIWAQGKYFFFFVLLQIYLLCSIDSLIDFKTKGPKRCVVWVLGLDMRMRIEPRHHTTPHHTNTTPP